MICLMMYSQKHSAEKYKTQDHKSKTILREASMQVLCAAGVENQPSPLLDRTCFYTIWGFQDEMSGVALRYG